MTRLAAFQFADPAMASELALRLGKQPGGPAGSQVLDAAVVTWEPGRGRPLARQVELGEPGSGLDAGFWGLVLGQVFFAPLLGASLGTASHTSGGPLVELGIDDHAVNRLRDRVTPGTSALLVLCPPEIADWIRSTLVDPRSELLAIDLDASQQRAVTEVFGPP